MRVWLLQPGEPMPIEEGQDRLWRTGYTAQLLAKRDHEVIWWGSNFSHFRKSFFKIGPGLVNVRDRLSIYLLPSIGYKRNVSIRRLREHRHVANQFRQAASMLAPPDLIVASYPTIELCNAAVDYGESHNVPVIVDVRDQWPDLFYEVFPRLVRGMVKVACTPISNESNHVFRKATSIIGNAPGAVDWALQRAKRPATPLDKAFPMAYDLQHPRKDQSQDAEQFWRAKGIYRESGKFVVAYSGAIGHTGDFKTVVNAAREVAALDKQVQIVFCGTGDSLESMSKCAADCANVQFVGWVDYPKLYTLLRIASVGLMPYKESSNFENGVTNKPIEYLSAGLPIVATLKRGVLRDLLLKHGCGLFYSSEDASQLASLIIHLSEKREELNQMSRAALKLYNSTFTAEKVYGEMIDHFQLVVRSIGRGRKTVPQPLHE